jgi:hypothetical protein
MISYIDGDVTKSKVKGLKVLPHIVNSDGFWNSGVVVPIGKKWPHVKEAYCDWYQTTNHTCSFVEDCEIPFLLGEVQFVKGDDEFVVANMLAQKSPGHVEVINGKNWPPIRHEALKECMERVAEFVKINNATIIAPWFGTLRAGSTKEVIKEMIEQIWGDLDVTIYEFNERK